jgi:hypothetical protein
LRAEYCHSVINELVDGEMEILAAGAGKSISEGSQVYAVHSRAAVNLPPGHFQLTRTGKRLRLEWTSDQKCGVSPVAREITFP